MKPSNCWTLPLLCLVLGAARAATPAPSMPTTPALMAPSPTTAKPGGEREIRAQLMPRRYTTVAAEIGAKVQRLPVGEGGSFKAGQLLVSFDCSLQQAQLAKARAELDGAEQSLKTNERLFELHAGGQLEVELARSARAKARAELGANQAVLGKCSVGAPFSGRVAEQKVREQQYVQPGQALLDIIDDSVLELEFLVPSHWLSWLKPGAALSVQIDETRKAYPARFTRIGARVDPVSQSVKVAAAIDGRFPELIAGMSGRVVASAPAQ
ncbi:efflux RND transporter periplasmic adaptor subunit [Hydrogenophaga pseudoflava]|uniref:efflux RND transporter periplasmic adaptor subunit n=1 Tax=Hydrogenophaga pseudoflava TaxID=47421 RepID=UPI0027E3D363|nr:efflux RND transporter periplasmic adaptor subunit [Hydrogenophaga pseudoflava]MDQ7744961.1 efflux RND transporter periplasmic adaptor subunit [Hydrogenophaga pseudoflava]